MRCIGPGDLLAGSPVPRPSPTLGRPIGSLALVFAYRRLALRRRVIVNLRTDKAIRGVLTRKSGVLLELRNAELYEVAGRPPIPMDGAVLVDRSNVDFIQVVGEV